MYEKGTPLKDYFIETAATPFHLKEDNHFYPVRYVSVKLYSLLYTRRMIKCVFVIQREKCQRLIVLNPYTI